MKTLLAWFLFFVFVGVPFFCGALAHTIDTWPGYGVLFASAVGFVFLVGQWVKEG
jgi:hypothetical protein